MPCGTPTPPSYQFRRGRPVNVIQKQLGHVSLATTDIYLRQPPGRRDRHGPQARMEAVIA